MTVYGYQNRIKCNNFYVLIFFYLLYDWIITNSTTYGFVNMALGTAR